MRETGNFSSFSPLNYKKAFQSNILSSANIIISQKSLVNSFKKNGYASIINVSSILEIYLLIQISMIIQNLIIHHTMEL